MALNQVDISMMEDIPAPGVAGKIIISDGTGWISGQNSPVGAIVKQATDPTISDPPSPNVGDLIMNNTTGELFCCTTVAVGANVWKNAGKGTDDVIPNDPPSNPTDDFPDLAENSTTNHTFTGATDTGLGAGTVDYYMVDNISDGSLLSVDAAEKAAGTAHVFTSTSVSANTDVTFRVRAKDNYGAYSTGVTITTTVKNLIAGHFLVVSGGGSSGTGGMSGGGGGGGVRTSWAGGSGGGGNSEAQSLFVPGTTYTCTVGNGGAAGPATGSQNQTWPADSAGIDIQGGVSSIAGTGFTTISCVGGATSHGGSHDGHTADLGHTTAGGGPHNGGCGGSGTSSGGLGTVNQGYAGGSASSYTYAGGGGAGTVGGNGGGQSSPSQGGGSGKQINIDGNNYYWAGGGGGAGHGTPGADGGIGGGGGGGQGYGNNQGTGGGSAINAGANADCNVPFHSDCRAAIGGVGGANTGGGAGSGADSSDGGSNGGSGIVIIRIPTADITGGASPTVTGAPTVATVGSDTVITFTGTGTFVA